jgi:hypothetical protein
MPLRLEAAILSRTRSPMSSRSNWAKDSSTLSVSRPMLELVLKACVTDTNETLWARITRSAWQMNYGRGLARIWIVLFGMCEVLVLVWTGSTLMAWYSENYFK